ncbi:hypothetical protein [Chryseobacterium sp. StRB126]|uniref:hypothetical protein n=1 Tax=Chryseobacterium sp. StRB126 TaxID=878220 RepID=UPI001494258E|nr:hypothetical protein [Chryseobacterium sp. StRB126]
MIQFILMLLGLTFQNNTINTVASNNSEIIIQSSVSNSDESTEDTSGDNGQLPPKK